MLDMIIDGIKYDYVGNLTLDNVNYVLYTDGNNLDISSYTYIDNKIELHNIDDQTYAKVLKEFKNE